MAFRLTFRVQRTTPAAGEGPLESGDRPKMSHFKLELKHFSLPSIRASASRTLRRLPKRP